MSRLLAGLGSWPNLLVRRHYSAKPLKYLKRNWVDIKKTSRNTDQALAHFDGLYAKACSPSWTSFRRSSGFQNNLLVSEQTSCSNLLSEGSIVHPQLYFTRNMATKKRKVPRVKKEDDAEEEEEDDDEEGVEENPLLVNDSIDGDDSERTVQTIDVVSLRLDAIAKVGFNITRAKVEEAFYEGKLYINGFKPEKKSDELSLGDEVDLVKRVSRENPDEISVTRLVIVGLPDKATQQGRYKLKIEKYPNITIESHDAKDQDD